MDSPLSSPRLSFTHISPTNIFESSSQNTSAPPATVFRDIGFGSSLSRQTICRAYDPTLYSAEIIAAAQIEKAVTSYDRSGSTLLLFLFLIPSGVLPALSAYVIHHNSQTKKKTDDNYRLAEAILRAKPISLKNSSREQITVDGFVFTDVRSQSSDQAQPTQRVMVRKDSFWVRAAVLRLENQPDHVALPLNDNPLEQSTKASQASSLVSPENEYKMFEASSLHITQMPNVLECLQEWCLKISSLGASSATLIPGEATVRDIQYRAGLYIKAKAEQEVRTYIEGSWMAAQNKKGGFNRIQATLNPLPLPDYSDIEKELIELVGVCTLIKALVKSDHKVTKGHYFNSIQNQMKTRSDLTYALKNIYGHDKPDKGKPAELEAASEIISARFDTVDEARRFCNAAGEITADTVFDSANFSFRILTEYHLNTQKAAR